MTKTLFDPVRLGRTPLSNRIVMAPMTRSRASAEGIPHSLSPLYYGQRASAGLIVSEATAVCKQGSGYPLIPGLWTDAQQNAWRKIADAVHAKSGKIFIQLYHTGRIAHSSLTGEQPVSASATRCAGKVMTASGSQVPFEAPRALDRHEISSVIRQFADAAARAIAAGADGVEIHAANGYLIDQFLRDGTNQRNDGYGGEITGRARLLIETIKAVSDSIGPDRVGVRLSPENSFNEMSDTRPVKTFTEVAQALSGRGLAYLHIIEAFTTEAVPPPPRAIYPLSAAMADAFQGPVILNRGYTLKSATEMIQSERVSAIAFGIPFIANPDLVARFKKKAPLASADPSKFYQGGAEGYIDYPTLKA